MTGTKLPDSILTDFDEIYHYYGDMLFRLAFVNLGNHSEAEDVLQDVMLRALNNKKPFQSPDHQKAWLIKVALNRIKSLRTSAWFRHWAREDETLAEDEKEDFSDVYSAVLELDEKYRTVIHLFYYEEYDVKSISSLLGISESSVKTRLYRGREALKERLKGVYSDL